MIQRPVSVCLMDEIDRPFAWRIRITVLAAQPALALALVLNFLEVLLRRLRRGMPAAAAPLPRAA